jgi:TonB family protein
LRQHDSPEGSIDLNKKIDTLAAKYPISEKWKAEQAAEEAKRKQAEEVAKLKAEEEARRKAELEAKRMAEMNTPRKAVLEAKLKAEEEARRKAESEAKRKAEVRRQAEPEDQESRRRAADWAAMYIRPKVTRSWLRPPSTTSNDSCRLHIRLLPGGEVESVEVIQSSGNPEFDRFAEAAARRASPLPWPSDPMVAEHLRSFTLTFKPDGGIDDREEEEKNKASSEPRDLTLRNQLEGEALGARHQEDNRLAKTKIQTPPMPENGSSLLDAGNTVASATPVNLDAQISALDFRLNETWQILKAAMPAEDFAVLKKAQLRWLKERDQCGFDKSCIKTAYEQRLRYLEALK